MFLRNAGRVLTRGQLIDRVWGRSLARPLHVHVEGLGVADVVRAPHPVDQLAAGEHPAGVAQEHLEQLELLERQLGVARR